MLDKNSPAFWRDIIPGSTITLSDGQSIADSMEKGEGVKGQDYVVESILKIQAEDSLAEWLLFNLGDEDQEIYLVAKIVDQVVDLMVSFEPDEFPPGNRKDLIDRDDTWLFDEPADMDNFEYDELQFVREIIWAIETSENGDVGTKEVLYQLKGQGVLYGSCTHRPVKAGMSRIMASVAEYHSDDDYENPDLMILELGGEKSDEGGLISLMIGCGINFNEVDVLKSRIEAEIVRKKPTLWEKMIKKLGN